MNQILNRVNHINQMFRKYPIVRIRFRKLNGDERILVGTGCDDLVPKEHQPKGTGNPNYCEAFPVFDLVKQEWRSFKPSSLIDIEGVADWPS
jgi:hypothetical protein